MKHPTTPTVEETGPECETPRCKNLASVQKRYSTGTYTDTCRSVLVFLCAECAKGGK